MAEWWDQFREDHITIRPGAYRHDVMDAWFKTMATRRHEHGRFLKLPRPNDGYRFLDRKCRRLSRT
jgi:hypothetical protein